MGLGGAVVAGGAAGRGDQPGDAARRGRPGRSSRPLASQSASRFGESQSARSWESKRVRNARLIGESRSANSPTAPGKTLRRCARSWLATATRWPTRSLRARQVRRSAIGGLAVGGQRPQPGPVGAQGVGQHERVEPVVLVAGRAVAAAQVLDLVRADHHHGDPGLRAGCRRPARRVVRSRPRRRRCRPSRLSRSRSPAAVCSTVRPVDLAAAVVDDRDGVVVAGPVDAGGHAVDGLVGQGVAGRLHVSLLAASPSGEAPVTRCRDAAAGSLTDRRSTGAQPCRRSARPG